ncbi:MAG: MGMT family protein [Candidatus Saccharimonadales bacterium]
MTDSRFKNDVYRLVALIPTGKVMTYGQIAALCGHPGAARVVGQIAHFGPTDLPWQRVVNARGGLAAGFVPDGRHGQARMLEAEGVEVVNDNVLVTEYLWWPNS